METLDKDYAQENGCKYNPYAQEQADWAETNAQNAAYIKNKPIIPNYQVEVMPEAALNKDKIVQYLGKDGLSLKNGYFYKSIESVKESANAVMTLSQEDGYISSQNVNIELIKKVLNMLNATRGYSNICYLTYTGQFWTFKEYGGMFDLSVENPTGIIISGAAKADDLIEITYTEPEYIWKNILVQPYVPTDKIQGDLIVVGNDGKTRKVIFEVGGTCRWEEI